MGHGMGRGDVVGVHFSRRVVYAPNITLADPRALRKVLRGFVVGGWYDLFQCSAQAPS